MQYYPNDSNYLLPSFNPPVEPPVVDPDTGDLIYVAYNPAWTAVLEGAVTQMMLYASWVGTDDEKKLAVARAVLLMEALQADLGEVETPFWDDETDVDDNAPHDMQPWYGYVEDPNAPAGELDFVESALLWAFTGLVAVATFELGGLAPAIFFHTTVEKFIIIQKRGDVAETIRYVVDNQDMRYVDTSPYAPGDLIETTIITPQTGGGHDLMIISTTPS